MLMLPACLPACLLLSHALCADNLATDTSRATSRNLSVSPRKLNDFAKVVRGLGVEDALIQVTGGGHLVCLCVRQLEWCKGWARRMR